jgi:serine/alanine racemase
MVFIIHIPPFQGEVSGLARYVNFGLQHYLCRLAVPFYFVSSGFFLFKKMPLYDLNTEEIKRYCFKLFRLIGTWYVLLFCGGTYHLWYLGATVVAVILLSFCSHFRIKYKYICLLACILYVIGMLGDSYYGLIAPIENFPVFNYILKGYDFAFSTTRNGVFMGFIFVLMGAGFSYYKIKLKPYTALIGFAISVLCLFAEVFLLKYNDIPIEYNMYVFLLPATFFLFSFAYTVQLKDHVIYKHLRNIGALIYFTHILVNTFVSLAIRVIDKYLDISLIQYQFLLSLLFTLVFAICVEWLSGKDKFKWINMFLS